MAVKEKIGFVDLDTLLIEECWPSRLDQEGPALLAKASVDLQEEKAKIYPNRGLIFDWDEDKGSAIRIYIQRTDKTANATIFLTFMQVETAADSPGYKFAKFETDYQGKGDLQIVDGDGRNVVGLKFTGSFLEGKFQISEVGLVVPDDKYNQIIHGDNVVGGDIKCIPWNCDTAPYVQDARGLGSPDPDSAFQDLMTGFCQALGV